MSVPTPPSLLSRLLGRLNLRFPVLVAVLAILTVLDILIPDVVPLVDEAALLLLTLLLSRWKARRPPGEEAPR